MKYTKRCLNDSTAYGHLPASAAVGEGFQEAVDPAAELHLGLYPIVTS
jgi:hypothetical protein